MEAVEDILEVGNQAVKTEVDRTAAGEIADPSAGGTAEGSSVHMEHPVDKAVDGSGQVGVADYSLVEEKAYCAAALGVAVALGAFAGLEETVDWALAVQACQAVEACHTVQDCMG